jgi:hypothetical protein
MDKEEVQEQAEGMSALDTFNKAQEMLDNIQATKSCRGIMVTYDPNTEKFQFIVMQADPEEVFQLLISGMEALKSVVDDTSDDRILN